MIHGISQTNCGPVYLLNIHTPVSKPIAIELHVLLYPNITHRYQQNMHNITREARQQWLILDVVSATFKWPGFTLCAASKRIYT